MSVKFDYLLSILNIVSHFGSIVNGEKQVIIVLNKYMVVVRIQLEEKITLGPQWRRRTNETNHCTCLIFHSINVRTGGLI